MAEALAEAMTEGAFINGALIGISENSHMFSCVFGHVPAAQAGHFTKAPGPFY